MLRVRRPVVIGFFEDSLKLEEIIAFLRDVGFRDDQLRIVMYENELATYRFVYDLGSMGLTEEEAEYCKQKLEAGHNIVAVRHEGRHWEAVNIVYDGRIHKYLRWVKSRGETENLPADDAPHPIEHSEKSSTREGAIPSWQKLLNDAGFGHLI